MHIYIEKYDRQQGMLLADFVYVEHLDQFCDRIGQRLNEADERTMILIEGLNFVSGIYPKEGCVYHFPDELITKYKWNRESIEESEEEKEIGSSDIIAFRAKGNGEIPSFFSKALKRYKWNLAKPKDLSYWDGKPCGGKGIKEDLSVKVRNVGQGNWNEVYKKDRCILIYDLGVSIKYNNHQVKQIIRNTQAFKDSPSLIISHWDIDHYKAIFQAESELLGSLCCVFCPAKLPNLTSERAFKRLKENCNYINSIEEDDSRLISRRISLSLVFDEPNFVLFRGEKSSDRNKSGLSIAVWNKNSSIILAGDHYYYQIFDYIYKKIPQGLKVNLVTPHHGGEAGSLKRYIGNIPNVNIAATSTGENNYEHPKPENKKNIIKMGFKWVSTNEVNGDIEILL
ncbi:hypothetical protein [Bacillus thuringiensis]|uniref:MBL fold metallo-hydrolase n=2 Tax=Bacillus thuringiensis TaxID=1428 RepID=A0AAW4HZL0_BACTU|nr:hypothetical protein [Bacillus thuringiensis]MBN9901370.1 hypothetical protein [Bacillus thuringiensis]MDY7521681.1 hypothetical protein [Bacillus thuringiensis]